MNSKNNPKRSARKLVIALVAVLSLVGLAQADVVRKLHTAPQRVMNWGAVGINDNNDATTGISSTIDLSGGDLDELNFAISLASAAGNGTGTFAVQVTPDGGTTWISNYSISITTNALTAVTTYYTGISLSPGTKARIVPTLTAPTTFYNVKVWAMPRAK